MPSSYWQWKPCTLIRQTGTSSYTVLDPDHTYTVRSQDYADPTQFDQFNGQQIAVWYKSGNEYVMDLNSLGYQLLGLLGKHTTVYRAKRDQSTIWDNSKCQQILDVIGSHVTLVDVTQYGSGGNVYNQPRFRYPSNNNELKSMPIMIENYYSFGGWFGINFPIYRANGTFYKEGSIQFASCFDATHTRVTFSYGAITGENYPTAGGGMNPWMPSNPYPDIDDSEPEGGETNPGGFTGDSIPGPSLPTISALGTGLVKLYNPNASQLSLFGRWLWGTGLSLDSLKRIFSDPMDMIIGLNIFPVSIPSSGSDTIKLGNLDSEVTAPTASSQYTTFDMGSIGVPFAYGSYLDFAPYTKVQIYLPFIGMKTLNTDEVMSKPGSPKYIHVSYSIDLLSGACVAHISVGPDTSHLSLMYEYGGSCSAQVPLTARDMTSIVSTLAGLVGVGAGAVLGTVMMPTAAMTGFAGGAVSASMIGSVAAGGAKQVIGSKPTVEHSGGIGSSTGFLSSQKAYLIIERPRLCHPENQEHFTGYPGFLYGVVSQLSGFTKFVNIELNNVLAEEAELEELEDWLVNRGVRL